MSKITPTAPAHKAWAAHYNGNFLVVKQYASGAAKTVLYGVEGDYWLVQVDYSEDGLGWTHRTSSMMGGKGNARVAEFAEAIRA